MTRERIPVIVTDKHRGVWYGWTDDPDADIVHLWDARHCYTFGTTEGIGELTVTGPGPAGKIGAVVKHNRIRDVVCVMDCEPAAVEAFRAAKWHRP